MGIPKAWNYILHCMFRYVRLLRESRIFIHVIARCKRNAAERCDVTVNSQ